MDFILQFAGRFANGLHRTDERQRDVAVFLDVFLMRRNRDPAMPENMTLTVSPT